MAKRNRNEFSRLVQETKPKIFALLTAKGKMRPIIIRDELNIDENLCRAALESLRDDGVLLAGKYYQIKAGATLAPKPDKPATMVAKIPEAVIQHAPPADSPTEKALALVRVENGALVTDSLIVAEVFGKRHDNVLQAIETLECTRGFTDLNFQVSEYKDSSGKTNTYYKMSRDGFMFLGMGFTGMEAARWKERIIEAFNEMEKALIHGTDELTGLAARLTKVSEDLQAAMRCGFGMMNNQIMVVDKKVDAVDGKVDRLGYRTAELEKKVQTVVNRGRRRINPNIMTKHRQAVILMGGNCPCCGTKKIIDDHGTTIEAEYDHFYQNSLADELSTWLICKHCHADLTRGKTSRVSRDPEFKAYQSKMNRLPGFQSTLLIS